MPDTSSPVFFLLPDGTKVSNDPRFTPDADTPEDVVQGQPSPHAEIATSVDLIQGSVQPDNQPKSLDEMTAEELKLELARLKDAGVEVNTLGVKKKADLVAAIKAAQENA